MNAPLLRDVRSTNWTADIATAPVIAVVMHGYGSQERDLAGLPDALGLTMPWASLRAPLELGNGGAAWFAITTPGNPDAQPVVDATDAIWAWIDANAGPNVLVVPIGFSQGGLMVSQLLRTRPERVVAPVVLGGFVLGAEQPGDATLAANRPPVFWGRGAEDQMITGPAVDRTSAFLPEHSTLVERIYPGLAHSINSAEIDDVRAFIGANASAPATL